MSSYLLMEEGKVIHMSFGTGVWKLEQAYWF